MGTRHRLGALCVAVCLVSTGACGGEPSSGRPLDRAESLAAAGEWSSAVESYLDALAIDGHGAAAGLAALTQTMVDTGVVLPVATENELLRWLESEDETELLRLVLAGSVVMIPEGWNHMGSETGKPDEQPARDVWLDSFSIDRHEVTNLEFEAFSERMGTWPPHWELGRPPSSHPVVGVSWEQAAAFCDWSGGRLPTEAEWERACRGPSASTYPWGDRWEASRTTITLTAPQAIDEMWEVLNEATGPSPQRVGEPAEGATPEGICNLADNVSEWVADWYARDAYLTLPAVNPVADGPEWNHVLRGGAWLLRTDDPAAASERSRCAARNSSHSIVDPRVGFRCAYDS